MEKSEVSLHEAKIYQALSTGQWFTSKGLAAAANVSWRTARHHLHRLVELGLLDQAELFPGHRYRLSEFASKRNAAYKSRLDRAVEIFTTEAK